MKPIHFLILFFSIGLFCFAYNKIEKSRKPVLVHPPCPTRIAKLTPIAEKPIISVQQYQIQDIEPVSFNLNWFKWNPEKDITVEEETEFENVISIENVRVTVYWKGQDYWTTRGLGCFGDRLEHKKSAAVDFRLDYFSYGDTIVIPKADMELKAVDTGGAVKRKSADYKYKRTRPVIDIYFDSKKSALAWTREHGDYMDILVKKS